MVLTITMQILIYKFDKNKIYKRSLMKRQEQSHYNHSSSMNSTKPNQSVHPNILNLGSYQLQQQSVRKISGWPTKVEKRFAPDYIIPEKISQSYEQYQPELQHSPRFGLKKKQSQMIYQDYKYEQSQKQNTLIEQLYLSQKLDKSGVEVGNVSYSPTNGQIKNQESPFMLMKHILNQYTTILEENKSIKSRVQNNQKNLTQVLQKQEELLAQNRALRQSVQALSIKEIQRSESISNNRQYLMKLEKNMSSNHGRCDRCDRLLQTLRNQFQIYKKDTQYMLRLIGDKCQVQESKMMRFLQIVQDNEYKRSQNKWMKEQKEEQSNSNLSIESKSSLPSNHNIILMKQQSLMRNQKQKLNAVKIQYLNLPPVTLKSVIINPISSTTTCYMIDISERQTNLQYIGQTGIWTHLLGRYRIDPNKTVQFVYKIKKSATSSIGVGIVDKKYQKIRACGKKQKNCIFYYGGSGRLWQAGQKLDKQGNGFSQGDTVIMISLLCEGIIRWYVNGILQAQYNSQNILIDGRWKDVEWVPFVNVSTSGDMITWQVGQ